MVGYGYFLELPIEPLLYSDTILTFHICLYSLLVIREVKHDVYGKRLTAKMKLLSSVFRSLYSRIKIFVFAVITKRHYSILT